ncbi:hypothetical protein VNO80_30469 [Phaseolus coccineus]|uniref:60S ribosomal protein L17 n=1 Tax=Phaseolus coccineus TaxID=3886 RepID=A0AAN9QFU2_PHACN
MVQCLTYRKRHNYAIKSNQHRVVKTPGVGGHNSKFDLCLGTGYMTACFALMVGPLGRAVGVEHIPKLVSFLIEYIQKSVAATELKDGSLSIHAGAMVKCSREPNNPTKSCKARGADLRVHFKNTRETTFAIRKLSLVKARRYLEDVLAHKQAILFGRFCCGVGRTAQAKSRHSNGQGRWTVKSAKFILNLLKNAESNAEVKGLDVDALYISHIQVHQAQKQRR